MTQVVISGTGLYTPSQSITNEELVATFNAWAQLWNRTHADEISAGRVEPVRESSVEFIEKASGIQRRYVLDKVGVLDPTIMCPRLPERPNEVPSLQCEMGIAACTEALAQAGRSASDVDMVLVACSNMQRPYPAMAIEIQAALGINGFGFDLNVACSSATFGIQTGVDAIRSGSARRVLVVNPEICSGHLNWRDRDSHFIFGDACTAVLLERSDLAETPVTWKVLGTRLKTVFSNNIRNNFGFMNRTAPETVGAPDKLFVQEGRKVFKEVVPMVATHIAEHLASLEIPATSLRRMWLHQANLSMNQLIGKKLLGREATADEAPVILDEFANTSSAGSIIAFHRYREDFAPGERGVICSFGAGYSIGSVVVERVG